MAMRSDVLPIFIVALSIFLFSSCRGGPDVEVCFLTLGKPMKCTRDASEIKQMMSSSEDGGLLCMNPEDLREVFRQVEERCSPSGMRNRAESEPQ
jgi:hypothetical protein